MSGNEYDYDKDSVNLWVEPEQKERWEEYLDEAGDLQHMSQLVRRAVENEISGRTIGGGVPDGIDDDLAKILGTIETLSDTVEGLDERLVAIEQAVNDDFDVRDLANTVFTILPTANDVEAVMTNDVAASADPVGTLCEIADEVEEPETHVRQALEKLRQDTAQVQTTIVDGETRSFQDIISISSTVYTAV